MKRFSFWKYALSPYDIITREYSWNNDFHKMSMNILIIMSIVCFMFFTIFFIIWSVIMLGMISFQEKNKKIATITWIILYWFDTIVIRNLEKRWKIKIPKRLKSQMPTNKMIQADLQSVSRKPSSYKAKWKKEISYDSSQKKSTWEIEFDFDFSSSDDITSSNNNQQSKDKPDIREKASIFDEYVSVRESFKNIKKR